MASSTLPKLLKKAQTVLWKPVPGYGVNYLISSMGNVKSTNRIFFRNGHIVSLKGKELKQHISKRGYYSVKLSIKGITKTTTIHSLVANAFIPNPNNLKCVNHIDGNKLNNSITNLEWCTHQQNMVHANEMGLIKKKRGSKFKKIVDTLNNKVFDSINDVINESGIGRNTLVSYLSGTRKNKTTYKYL